MSVAEDLAKALTKGIGENDEKSEVTDWLNTGFPNLNMALSGRHNGGLGFGRLYEMYGPSSSGKTAIATYLMIEAQRRGGVAVFIDYERSFDLGMAVNMGLKDEFPFFIYKQPETWEEGNTQATRAAQIIRESKAIPENAPIFIVQDSIASATPKSMLYDSKGKKKEMDELTMNDTTALSRVTSTTLKVVAQLANELNATVLYLNQIRTKIGVLHGDPTCLRGDTVVPLTNGTSMKIKDIVDNKVEADVWSYNESSGEFEERKIVNWFDNGKIPDDQDWIHIKTSGVETKNGVCGMTVTPDHKVFIEDNGWCRADSVSVSDMLLTKRTTKISGTLREFIFGVFAGDCSLRKMSDRRTTANMKIQDNNDPDYARWKVDKLSPFFSFKRGNVKWKGGEGVRYDSEFTSELASYVDVSRDPLELMSKKSAMQMAIWIMDDGYMDKSRCRYTVSVKRKKNADYLDNLADMFFETWGLTSRVREREGALIFNADSSRKIAEMIAPFVPECMERKLPEEHRGKYIEFDLTNDGDKIKSAFVPVTSVSIRDRQGYRGRYDIEVESNHNYLVGNKDNGVLVHNCTPGGGAMEFYASGRISLGRTKVMETVNGDKEMTAQIIRAKITKSKHTRPFKVAELRMGFNDDGSAYFEEISVILDYLVKLDIIETAGAYVLWDGKKYHRKTLAKKIIEDGDEDKLRKMVPDYV